MAIMTPSDHAKAERLLLDLYRHLDRFGEDGDAFTDVYQSLDSYVSAHAHLLQQHKDTTR